MCGHSFMYHNHYQLQRHRPVWRCSTCGREAYVPLDCCARPEFAPRQYVTLGQRGVQGLGAIGRWVLTSLAALRGRYSLTPAVTMPEDNRAVGITVEAGVVGAEADAETAVGVGASMTDGESV